VYRNGKGMKGKRGKEAEGREEVLIQGF